VLYLSIKAIHIIAVISWMAGILYLPRLFIYHVDAEKGSVQSETFKVMERRLMKAIMTPSMLVTWIAGIAMISLNPGIMGGWLMLKIVFVIAVSALHFFYAGCLKKFATDTNERSTKFYRIINEVPALFMVIIVFLVVLQPF